MTGSGNNGWLVPLADLSLILFVITGAGMAGTAAATRDDAIRNEAGREDEAGELAGAGAALGVASAMFVDSDSGGLGAEELSEWLAAHRPGPGEQLTVLGTYRSEAERSAIAARCEALAAQAMATGIPPRVIVEQGEAAQVMAYLAHDRIPAMARDLLRAE